MYNFHELRRECRDKPLPDDVNKLVEERSLKVFGDVALVEMLKQIRIKKNFGTAFYLINGFPVAEYEFQFGICPRFELIGEIGVSFKEFIGGMPNPVRSLVFKRSVHNEAIDMRSKKDK